MIMEFQRDKTFASQPKFKWMIGTLLCVGVLFAEAVWAQTPPKPQCAAKVSSFSLDDAGPSTHITFNISVNVPTSRGSFTYYYKYRDANGDERSVDKDAPNWTPSDGQDFTLPDDIGVPKSEITSFHVSTDTVTCESVS